MVTQPNEMNQAEFKIIHHELKAWFGGGAGRDTSTILLKVA